MKKSNIVVCVLHDTLEHTKLPRPRTHVHFSIVVPLTKSHHHEDKRDVWAQAVCHPSKGVRVPSSQPTLTLSHQDYTSPRGPE